MPEPPMHLSTASDLNIDRQALAHFQRLMDASPEAQQQAITQIQHSDPEVAARLNKMLRLHLATTEQQIRQLTTNVFRELPNQLGPFRILGVLGEGGMGRVVRGVRQIDRREQYVAIKLVYAPANQYVIRERFIRERELLARLQHPAIAALIDFGESADGLLWYAMALIDGIAITSYAANINQNAKLQLILDLCEVLRYAHALGVFHRDIKPHNVLVNSAGELHLIDFGIAKTVDDDSSLSVLGHSPMTPMYAAPEQIERGTITTATDQWQIAALLYVLLTGQHYEHKKAAQRARQHNATISKDLDAVITKALRTNAAERYDSITHFAHDLRACLQGRPVQARMSERWYELRSFVARHRWGIASAAITTCALLFATWYSYSAAQLAKQQALIAERSSTLLSEIFLSDEQGAILPQLNLGGLIAHGVDQVIADQVLPIAARIKLLDELAERATEVEEFAAAVRGGEEVLRLTKSQQPVDRMALRQANASLAMMLMNSPWRTERDTEVRALIAQAFPDAPVQSKLAAHTSIAALRASAFYAAYQNDFKQALELAEQAKATSDRWLTNDPWAHIHAIRTLAVMYAAANRNQEATQSYQQIVDYAQQWLDQYPKLKSTTQWDRAQLCELLSYHDPQAGLRQCAANVQLLQEAKQEQSLLGFENLSGWGRCLAAQDDSKAALERYQRAEQILIKLEGETSQSLRMASIRRRIGNRLIALGQPQAALAPLEFALAAVRMRLAAEHRDVLEISVELAQALVRTGQLARAKTVVDGLTNTAPLSAAAQRRYQEVLAALDGSRWR